jgi:hypothetical protein
MKGIKVTLAVAASALLLAAPAMAFHDGGVAQCESCHTMHNSVNGAKFTDTAKLGYAGLNQYQAGPYLLLGATQSEACLNCHESTPGSYHISNAAGTNNTAASANGTITQFTPGGDFRWLTVKGQNYGHSINAPAFGYTSANLSTAPGGGATPYPGASLACSSCHDPHGKYRRTADTGYTWATTGAPIIGSGSYNNSKVPTSAQAVGAYRILGGNGYQPKSTLGAGNLAFSADPPTAVANSTYNASETTIQGKRVAYGAGMSEWCANCHGKMHQDTYTSGQTGAINVHPAGNGAKLTAAIATNYQTYVSSGIMTGTAATSSTSLVPFETGSSDFSGLRTVANGDNTGADTSSNVMCLSCHRAHASGFSSMTRFGVVGFMTTDNGSGTTVYSTSTTAGSTNGDLQAAYNNRPANLWPAYQRNLCNKCHAKD